MPNSQCRVVRTIAEARDVLRALREAGERIAFVPTMGALHEGHLTLVDVAARHADAVVASIFVNPLQFGPKEDFGKYPRTLDADLEQLQARNVAVVFTPSAEEMYPYGSITTVTAAPHDGSFEGAIRPGHFTGVLTVVAKLFNIVQPDVACFGQKDLQQLSLIRSMVRDLDLPIEIVSVPTVRDVDGLALSSRNRYLGDADRQRVTKIPAALNAVRDLFENGERNAPALLQAGQSVIFADRALTLDYIALVDPITFIPTPVATPGTAVIIAARAGGTRLLDNIIL